MARTVRDAKLEKWAQRKDCAAKQRYYRDIGDGIALCYRRGGPNVVGTWSVRIRGADGRYALVSLGVADDNVLPADGERVLNYRQACAKAIEEAARGPKTAYTVADAIDDYLAWYREHRKAIEATEATIKAHIRPALGHRPVAELTSTELKEWRDKLARAKARRRTARGKAQEHKREREKATDEEKAEAKRARRATANRILAVLKAILNKAFEDEKVADDKAWRRVAPFEKVDVPRVRFLTESESVRIVNASNPDFRPLVRAALLTGARYGELVRMTVGAFNERTGQLFIAPSKSGKARHVPLNAAGVALFNSLTLGREPDAPMFVRGDNGTWGKNHQQRPMIDACKAAKITPALRFHECRHTYASALAQAGADLLTVSKLLGHADTRITARHYAHLCDRTLANAVNNLLPNFGAVEETNVAAIR
jgi:integrase